MEPEPESATSPTSPYPRLLSCAAEHVPSKSGGKAGKQGIQMFTLYITFIIYNTIYIRYLFSSYIYIYIYGYIYIYII